MDNAHIELVIQKLREAWLKYPSLRLGQLVETCFWKSGKWADSDIFYAIDSLFLDGVEKLLEEGVPNN